MRTRITTAALLLAAAMLTACESGSHTDPAPAQPAAGSDPAACHDALKAQYEPGTVTLTGAPTEPPACQGLTSDEVSKIAGNVINEQLNDAASPTP